MSANRKSGEKGASAAHIPSTTVSTWCLLFVPSASRRSNMTPCFTYLAGGVISRIKKKESIGRRTKIAPENWKWTQPGPGPEDGGAKDLDWIGGERRTAIRDARG